MQHFCDLFNCDLVVEFCFYIELLFCKQLRVVILCSLQCNLDLSKVLDLRLHFGWWPRIRCWTKVPQANRADCGEDLVNVSHRVYQSRGCQKHVAKPADLRISPYDVMPLVYECSFIPLSQTVVGKPEKCVDQQSLPPVHLGPHQAPLLSITRSRSTQGWQSPSRTSGTWRWVAPSRAWTRTSRMVAASLRPGARNAQGAKGAGESLQKGNMPRELQRSQKFSIHFAWR